MIADLLGHKTVAMAQNVYNQAMASQLAPVAERKLSEAAPMNWDVSSLQSSNSSEH
jgi:integrase